VSYEIFESDDFDTEVHPSSQAPFPGYLLPQLWTWMAWVANQDGPGSSFLYASERFPIGYNPNHFHLGRIVFVSDRRHCFLHRAFDTTRIQVLNWARKRVSLSSVYITFLHLTIFSIVMGRLERDRPVTPVDVFSTKEILRSLASPHVMMIFIIFFLIGTMLFGLALYLPSIVHQLGFSPTKTQLLSVGPFAAGFFGQCFFEGRYISNACSLLVPLVTIFSAYWSDYYQSRGITAAIITLLAVAGYSLFLGKVFCVWFRYFFSSSRHVLIN